MQRFQESWLIKHKILKVGERKIRKHIKNKKKVNIVFKMV